MKDKVLQLAIFLAIVGISFAYLNTYSFAYIDAPNFGKDVPFFLYAFFGAIVGYGIVVFAIRNKLVCQISAPLILLCVVADISALIFLMQKISGPTITTTFIVSFHACYCTFIVISTFVLTVSATNTLEDLEEGHSLYAVCKCGRKSMFSAEQTGSKIKCTCGRMVKLQSPAELA